MEHTYQQLDKEILHNIKPGDIIERMLGFVIPDYLRVTEVNDQFIYCGPKNVGWKFDRDTGLEVDEDLTTTPSYLARVLTEEQKVKAKTLKRGERV